MSGAVERGEFLKLIDQFLRRTLAAPQFCDQFVPLWMRDTDATLAKRQSWPRPYDQELLAARDRGELSREALEAEFAKLWGYDPIFQRMIDAVHSACSAYRPDPEAKWEIGEEELRRDVEKALSDYVAAGGPAR
jgi:hypothetical protein